MNNKCGLLAHRVSETDRRGFRRRKGRGAASRGSGPDPHDYNARPADPFYDDVMLMARSPLRCAIYVRQLTEGPDGEEALAPWEQEELIRERIARDPNLVAMPEVYSDDLTEGPAPRPGLRALFDDVAIGLVDHIAVYGLNYILEDQQDSAALLKCLEDCPRVKILSAGDTIVANTLRGSFAMHITTDYIAEPAHGQLM